MNKLIKIKQELIGTETVNSVNSRDIHTYLGVKTHLSTWIQRAIKKYDFKENIDFSILKSGNPNGGIKKLDYIVTLDMAKELAMLENN
jgi:phage anti-repressor protein